MDFFQRGKGADAKGKVRREKGEEEGRVGEGGKGRVEEGRVGEGREEV